MPEKSYRDMSELERRHYSLSARTFRATVLGSAIVGIVALVIGLLYYTWALSKQYISLANSTAHHAAMSVSHGSSARELTKEVLDIYYSLTPEERATTKTEEYRARFGNITEKNEYRVLINILKEFCETEGLFDVYLGMYDRDNCALVYIVDPDQSEMYCGPGDWETVEREEMERFLAYNDDGELYDIGNTELYGLLCTAAAPIRDKETNEIVCFVLADVTLENIREGAKTFALRFALTLITLTALIAWFMSRHMQKTLVKPINDIADAAQRYARDRKDGKEYTDHFAMLNISTGDEVEKLSLIMADMERDISEYTEHLTSVTAEKERIATELNMAAGIQASMLPNTFPAFPERDEFDIFATMTPAKEVGGDFYDFFMIDDDHLAMVMADVSGKGVPAALFMMTSRTMIKDAVLAGFGPAEAMKRVNANLAEHNGRWYMFVTVWLGILEISTGKLRWVDAGHEKPLLYHDGSWRFVEKHPGPALGAFEPEILERESEPAFVAQELQLYPGDVIYQYTDGVTEAMTYAREQFGQDRLLAAADSAPSQEPEILLPHIRTRIDAFVKEADQFDDITMLALRYRGK